MTQLGQLEIVGALSECSLNVRVRNQVVGAQVELRVGSNVVASGTATWPDEAFKLTKALHAGELVRAFQALAAYEPSAASAAVKVDPPPTPEQLSKGSFRDPIYQCAQCVWLQGLFPGATVQVFSKNQSLSDPVQVREDGHVQVSLLRPLTPADDLRAIQTACQGTVKSKDPIQGGAPKPLPNQLPKPVVKTPQKCDRFISITNLTEGCEVTIWRGGKKLKTFCSALHKWNFFPVKKLMPVPEDSLQVQYEFPGRRCGQKSDKSDIVEVEDTEPGVPDVLPPLCAGQKYVKLADLVPGATVELTVNGDALLFGAPFAVVKYSVPALQEGTAVIARQNICGEADTWGPLSSGMDQVSTTKPVPPTKPKPADGATNVTVAKPWLSWKDDGGYCNEATHFNLKVSKVKDGQEQPVVSPMGLSSTKDQLPTLEYATTYRWQVQALKGAQVSDWSAVWTFTTVENERERGNDPGQDESDALEVKRRCFVQDCCSSSPSFYRVTVSAIGTHSEALQHLEELAPSGCWICPIEVECDFKPPPCSQFYTCS